MGSLRVVKPSVSSKRVKLWSYADLMALRIVYWLRHTKSGPAQDVVASPLARVHEAMAELEQRGLDIWDDREAQPGSPLRVDSSATIRVAADGAAAAADGQQALPGTFDLLGPFEFGGCRGPELLRPRPSLRIVPEKVSGEPHLAGSRVTTQVVAALYRNIPDGERIAGLYPGIHVHSVGEAIEFERSLTA